MASTEFEIHVDLELNARLECGHCPAELEIDQDVDAANASDRVKDFEQKLGIQAELEHWELSDLGGKLDSVCPCCDECMSSFKRGTL